MRSAIGAALPDELVLDRESCSTASCERMEQTVTEVFVMLRDPVYRYLSTMLHNPAEAEDLTQDIFLKIFKSLDTFDRRANFQTWLISISRNLCIDHYRSVRKERETMARDVDPADLTPVSRERSACT